MKRRIPVMAAVFSVVCAFAGCALCPCVESAKEQHRPFDIVKSFPVMEPTCGMKSGGLYLVAAERSMTT